MSRDFWLFLRIDVNQFHGRIIIIEQLFNFWAQTDAWRASVAKKIEEQSWRCIDLILNGVKAFVLH